MKVLTPIAHQLVLKKWRIDDAEAESGFVDAIRFLDELRNGEDEDLRAFLLYGDYFQELLWIKAGIAWDIKLKKTRKDAQSDAEATRHAKAKIRYIRSEQVKQKALAAGAKEKSKQWNIGYITETEGVGEGWITLETLSYGSHVIGKDVTSRFVYQKSRDSIEAVRVGGPRDDIYITKGTRRDRKTYFRLDGLKRLPRWIRRLIRQVCTDGETIKASRIVKHGQFATLYERDYVPREACDLGDTDLKKFIESS